MVTWEYQVIDEAAGATEALVSAGAAGWEAFAVVPIEWDGYASFDVKRVAIYLRRPA